MGSLPGDRASCSVLGSLNLHLYKEPALLGVQCSLYPPNFPEEVVLDAEAELGSQPSLSMCGLSQRREAWLGPPLLTAHLISLAPEDSEVSSQCPSASSSSGSDGSCVSGQALARGLEDLSCVSVTFCLMGPAPPNLPLPSTFSLGEMGMGGPGLFPRGYHFHPRHREVKHSCLTWLHRFESGLKTNSRDSSQ